MNLWIIRTVTGLLLSAIPIPAAGVLCVEED